MRSLFKYSIFFGVLFLLISLFLHLRSITGVWAGVPYRVDVMNYPYTGLDRWAVAFVAAGVVCIIYGFIVHLMLVDRDVAEEMRRYESLKVLNGKS